MTSMLATKVGQAVADAAARLRRAGLEDPVLEAEVLLSNALRVSRSQILASRTDDVDTPTLASFEALLARRIRHEPLAYVVGEREFYGLAITCDARGLIPRPETEMLVDVVLEELKRRGPGLRIIDVGTGTGAIAVAVTTNALEARVLAVDASLDALRLTAKNAAAAGVDRRVDLVRTDLLAGIRKADVVVANLPYVSEADWLDAEPEVRDWEPRSALVGGPEGPELVCAFLRHAPAVVDAEGIVAVEIGAGQARVVTETAAQWFPSARIEVLRDLAGIERVVIVYRSAFSEAT